MKIGLIQSRGIGDIIISLPIAKFFVDRGDQVIWPISQRFIDAFRVAAPYVRFLPIVEERSDRWFYDTPLELLESEKCERIIPLYSYLRDRPEVVDPILSQICKFDEYKYAVANVPFREKWRLALVRNLEREEKLFRRVVKRDEFVVFHLQGSTVAASIDKKAIAAGRPIIDISPVTNNPFDWLKVIESASIRVMIDSCFSNLTDQLNIPGKKIFIPRSSVLFTPVLLGDWEIIR